MCKQDQVPEKPPHHGADVSRDRKGLLQVQADGDRVVIVLPRLDGRLTPGQITAELFALRSMPSTARCWVVDCSALGHVPYPVLDALLCFGSDLYMDGRRLEIQGLSGRMIPVFYAESLKPYLTV